MSSSEAELTLLLKARNLATRELNAVKTSIEGITTKVGSLASAFARGAAGLGKDFFRNLTYGLQGGQGLDVAFQSAGAMLALSLVESLGAKVVATLASSAFLAPISAALAAEGATAGSVLAAAIPIGMAALPFLLAAAAVAALVFLVTHPEVVAKIRDVALGIIGGIAKGLLGLGGKLVELFTAAVGLVASTIKTLFTTAFNVVLGIITGIVDTIVGVIERIIDTTKEALRLIGLLDGPAKLNDKYKPNQPKDDDGIRHHAAGGWAGLNGPELSWLGENGPEYVRKAGTGTGDGTSPGRGAGVMLEGVSEAQLLDMVERGLYFRLRRAGTGV